MREIKFRFWFKRYKEMSEGYSLFNFGKDVEEESDFKDTLIPMQYTGLEDENGNEIYEGDIVELECPYSINRYQSIVKWNEKGYWEPFNNPEDDVIGFKIPKNQKIIGNIYENPELAKDLTP